MIAARLAEEIIMSTIYSVFFQNHSMLEATKSQKCIKHIFLLYVCSDATERFINTRQHLQEVKAWFYHRWLLKYLGNVHLMFRQVHISVDITCKKLVR